MSYPQDPLPFNRRPTHTILIPLPHLAQAIAKLVKAGCTFTCESSPTRPDDVWHIGCFEEGVAVINQTFGPTVDVGTLGDFYPGKYPKEGAPER